MERIWSKSQHFFSIGKLVMVKRKQRKVYKNLYENKPQVSEASSHCSLADCCAPPKSLSLSQGSDRHPRAKNKNIRGPKHRSYTICNLEEKQYYTVSFKSLDKILIFLMITLIFL